MQYQICEERDLRVSVGRVERKQGRSGGLKSEQIELTKPICTKLYIAQFVWSNLLTPSSFFDPEFVAFLLCLIYFTFSFSPLTLWFFLLLVSLKLWACGCPYDRRPWSIKPCLFKKKKFIKLFWCINIKIKFILKN